MTVGDAHEQLMAPLVEATRALRVGDGMEESSDVGPVISCASRDRINDWIERGVSDGAKLAVDGRGEGPDTEGASFVGPTILDDVAPGWRLRARRCSARSCA